MDSICKNDLKPLILAIINVLLLSIGYYLSNYTLLTMSNIIFILIFLFSNEKNILSLIYFYLPWSGVLKISPNSFSLLTLVLPILTVKLIMFRHNRLIIKSYYLVHVLLLVLLVLLVQIFTDNVVINYSFIHMVFMLIFIPFYLDNSGNNKLNFNILTIYLITGIVIASFISNIYYHITNMNIYRQSGFFDDPNYFSTQILMAIALLFIVISNNKNVKRNFMYTILIILLLYFGMLTISKMFIIIFIILLFIFVIYIIISTKKLSTLIAIISTVSILIVITLNLFNDQIKLYIYRFATTDLTTGRINIQKMYIDYFFQYPRIILFGNGFTERTLNGYVPHNTFLQIVYLTGIIGLFIILFWFYKLYKTCMNKIKKINLRELLLIMILFCSYVSPWLALDYLLFDHFFYYYVIVLMGVKYILNKISKTTINY